MHVPCGCASRKQIMFTQGNLGVTEVGFLIAVPVVILLLTKVM